MPILTAKQGTNADLFPDILKLYVPENSLILDMTYGRGVFWKNVDISKYFIYRNDLNSDLGESHEDFRETSWDDSVFDAVVFDPPYLYVGGFRTFKASVDAGYGNRQRAVEQGIYGVAGVDKMYKDGILEAHRILKPKGILIGKCMDQVMSGKVVMQHRTYINYAESIGFIVQDFFVLVQQSVPTMRHNYQIHARRNHSYFMVLRKIK
jgi:hypothetical protein